MFFLVPQSYHTDVTYFTLEVTQKQIIFCHLYLTRYVSRTVNIFLHVHKIIYFPPTLLRFLPLHYIPEVDGEQIKYLIGTRIQKQRWELCTKKYQEY